MRPPLYMDTHCKRAVEFSPWLQACHSIQTLGCRPPRWGTSSEYTGMLATPPIAVAGPPGSTLHPGFQVGASAPHYPTQGYLVSPLMHKKNTDIL